MNTINPENPILNPSPRNLNPIHPDLDIVIPASATRGRHGPSHRGEDARVLIPGIEGGRG